MATAEKTFRVIVNVIDIITNINVKTYRLKVCGVRNQAIAEREARKQVNDVVIEWVKSYYRAKYKLTAEQLSLMIKDGFICTGNIYYIEVAMSYELRSDSFNHPYVREVYADSLY